jgi:hypothetical protein
MLRPLSNSSIQETNPLKVCIRTTQHLLPGVEKRRDGCTIPWQAEGICSQFDTWSQKSGTPAKWLSKKLPKLARSGKGRGFHINARQNFEDPHHVHANDRGKCAKGSHGWLKHATGPYLSTLPQHLPSPIQRSGHLSPPHHS